MECRQKAWEIPRTPPSSPLSPTSTVPLGPTLPRPAQAAASPGSLQVGWPQRVVPAEMNTVERHYKGLVGRSMLGPGLSSEVTWLSLELDTGSSIRLKGAKAAHTHWSQPHVGHLQVKDVDFMVQKS